MKLAEQIAQTNGRTVQVQLTRENFDDVLEVGARGLHNLGGGKRANDDAKHDGSGSKRSRRGGQSATPFSPRVTRSKKN